MQLAISVHQVHIISAVRSLKRCPICGAGVRKLEALFAVLITTMAVTFGVEYVIAGPNQADVMFGLVRTQAFRETLARNNRNRTCR